MMWIDPEFEKELPAASRSFDALMAIEGEVFREKEGRRTLRFKLGERSYFIKQHRGIGWREIAKNLLFLRLPVLGALREWRALRQLEKAGIGVARPLAAGSRGWNPARLESFLVLEDISRFASLEIVLHHWRRHAPTLTEKRRTIASVAKFVRKLHDIGVNHRDLYPCHIYFDNEAGMLRLLDLHRAQLRPSVPFRWRVKDVAALLAASRHFYPALTAHDFICFATNYDRHNLREVIADRQGFWQRTLRRSALFKQA